MNLWVHVLGPLMNNFSMYYIYRIGNIDIGFRKQFIKFGIINLILNLKLGSKLMSRKFRDLSHIEVQNWMFIYEFGIAYYRTWINSWLKNYGVESRLMFLKHHRPPIKVRKAPMRISIWMMLLVTQDCES